MEGKARARGMPQIERIGRLKGPLTIACLSCGHRATWPVADAVRRLGGECMVTGARSRARLAPMCNLYSLKPGTSLKDLAAAFDRVLGLTMTLSAGDATLANQPW